MPVPNQRDAVERQLLRETAYTALRDAIVGGTLTPGESLHDHELCGWLGLSRTPVRDALTRLKDEGLIDMAPQRYTRVAALGARDAYETFPLVAAIHALATELAVPRMTGADIARLQAENDAFIAALRAAHAVAAYDADERFHSVFLDACDNAEIVHVLDRLAPRMRRLERLHGGSLPARRLVAHHQAIIARADAGDAAAAASAVRENWLTLGGLIHRALSPTGGK
jgi:DNA-binding GntR family transcriptional regulator